MYSELEIIYLVNYMKYTISLLPDPIAITIQCKKPPKNPQRFVIDYQSFIEKRHMTQKYQWVRTHAHTNTRMNAHLYKSDAKSQLQVSTGIGAEQDELQTKKIHNTVTPKILHSHSITEFKNIKIHNPYIIILYNINITW